MDQHLFAEFREIKMVPKALRRSLAAASKRAPGNEHNEVIRRIPPEFTLNAGHVSFFYDKGAYLAERFRVLCDELDARGIRYDKAAVLDDAGVFASLPPSFNKQYTPTTDALAIVRERIETRISQRPGWYRYTGTSK